MIKRISFFLIILFLLSTIFYSVESYSKPKPKAKKTTKTTPKKRVVKRRYIRRIKPKEEKKVTSVKIGALAWYSVWIPVYKNLLNSSEKNLSSIPIAYNDKGDFLIGPVISVDLTNRWGISTNFLIGVKKYTYSYIYNSFDTYIYGGGVDIYRSYTIADSKAKRFNLDIEFSYILNKYFKFLIGLKGVYYKGTDSETRIYGDVDFCRQSFYSWFAGPGLGLGISIPLPKNFYLTYKIVGIASFGNYNIESKNNYHYGIYTFLMPERYNSYFGAFGADTSLFLNYYFNPIRITLSGGFRYQMLYHIYAWGKSSNYDLNYRKSWIKGEFDHVYGFIMAMTFKF